MDDTNCDLDHWLVELESNDSSSMASVLCTIYDSDKSEKFLNKLETRILHHDQEIERMCSAHYKSFIDCIRELLQVRPNAERLKRETMEINSELMKSTDVIQRKADELIKARRILVNSSSSIELLDKCRIVLDQYLKFNEQLKEKRYFPALKTLESLERDHLPTVSSYRFAQSMCKEIPEFRIRIKRETKEDLNSFLEGLLVKSQKIGETVLKTAAKQQSYDDHDQLFDKIAGIDFSPVYRGLHIFTNLGFREEFDGYYREQRQKQSRLAFSPPTNMSISISAYHDYFSSVIGFFVVEDHLMGTTKDFIDADYLNELWQSAIQSMTESLKQNVKLCRDASLILEIKKLMMLFTFTIRNYGHNTDSLAEILITIREQYNEILMNQWKEKFDDIFRQDNYHPLEVHNYEDFLQVVGALDYLEKDTVNFPKKLPYSLFVPKVYEEVRNFIEQSLKFSQDLNSSQADVESMVRKSTNLLLTQTLGTCLRSLINDSSLQLLQLIQIFINLDKLEDAMELLDAHITYQISKSISGLSSCYPVPNDDRKPNLGEDANGDSNNTQFAPVHRGSTRHPRTIDNGTSSNTFVKLQGKSMFKDVRAEAESQIYRKINDQIEEFIGLADYDWIRVGASGQASSFILDLNAWLRSTFQAFTNLTGPVAQGACMSACKHIAQSLRGLILSEDVKALSIGGLEQFNLDLMQCELFASAEPVQGFKEGDLLMAFAELRQLCDLFLYEDYSTYMSDMGKQQNKYLRVTTATALAVVDKLREHDRKGSVFALKKNDKQKLRDTFAKNLRQVQQQQSIKDQQYQQHS